MTSLSLAQIPLRANRGSQGLLRGRRYFYMDNRDRVGLLRSDNRGRHAGVHWYVWDETRGEFYEDGVTDHAGDARLFKIAELPTHASGL